MFDVGGGELLVIGIVALIVIGPKELPGLLRQAGNAMGKVRRMAAEFRGQFDEAMREAEIDQAKKAFADVNEAAQSARPTFNPLDTIRNEIQSVKEDMKGSTQAATPLPDPKIDLPSPPPPVNIVADVATPPQQAVDKPKRTRKKADEKSNTTPGTSA
jgi:sec-independent protein translocase protein TatB